MQYKLFDQCDLMLIKEERKSRLYKVDKLPDGSIQLQKMKYLSADHTSIDVYPKCNLIISSRTIYTLDENVVVSRLGADVSLYDLQKSWLIVLDYKRDSDNRYCAIWWNGKQKYQVAYGRQLIITKKYLALYIQFEKYWTIYTEEGALVLEPQCLDSQEIEIRGDFLLLHAVGNHAIYSLLKQRHQYALQCNAVFHHQQLILCSEHDDFVICCGLSGKIQSYYQGRFMQFESAEHIKLLDFASLFCLKRGDKFFLYRFNGEQFATDLCPEGADFVGDDSKDKSLLIGVGATYHRLTNFD